MFLSQQQPARSGNLWENNMTPSSTLLAFGTLVLGAAVAVAQPVTSTAPVKADRDCSTELARQSIARMQRQAQPEAMVGANCLAAKNAISVETAKNAKPTEVASSQGNTTN
jgi:hypothetical protein